jgi:hypothetical protein
MNQTRHAFQIQADQTLGQTLVLAPGEVAPADCTFTPPPEHDPNALVLWVGNGWQVIRSEHTREAILAQSRRATVQQRARELATQIDAERDRRIAQGKPHRFPDGLTGTVQLRNERDTGNVNAVATSGTALVIAGDAEARVVFRDAEDVSHPLSGEEAVAFGLAVMAWVSAHYAAAWAHKDAIWAFADRGDVEALSGYDVLSGWPEHEVEEAEEGSP